MAGINVGDATLSFLADTTKLDATLNTIGPRTKAAMQPATDAVSNFGDAMDDAGSTGDAAFKKVGSSSRGATEQVRFLGEEVGVRLPRAMGSLIATMPGVGAALNVAFNAVAIIFFAKMLADITDKVSKFAAAKIYDTDAIEAHNKAMGEEGKLVAANIALMHKAQAEYASLTDTRTPIEKLNATLKAQGDEYDRLNNRLGEYTNKTDDFYKTRKFTLEAEIALTQEQIVLQEKADTEANNAKTLASLKEEISLRKQLAETQVAYMQVMHGLGGETADEMRYKISLQALRAQADAESKFGKDSINRVREINAQIEALQVDHAKKMLDELNTEKEQTTKLLDDYGKELQQHNVLADIIPPTLAGKFITFNKEAKELGLTLQNDVAAKAELAKKALADYLAMGGNDARTIKELQKSITDTTLALQNFGVVTLEQNENQMKALETQLLEARARGLDTRAIQQQIKDLNTLIQTQKQQVKISNESIQTMDHLKDSATQMAQQMGDAVASAMQGMLTHQENFGKAMEKAVLGMIGKQAEAWGQYFIALGMASIWTDPAGGAAMLAEGFILEALGGALGAAGSGGASGSSGGNGTPNRGPNNDLFSYGSSVSNTGSQAGSGRSGVGVQGFATGALITRPTLATFAENGPEAAIPLNDPEALKAIGSAIAEHSGGGDTHIHFHAPVVGASDVSKLCKQINKRVGRGQANLTASNSMRVTKRSA
jgi:hypothetical protein